MDLDELRRDLRTEAASVAPADLVAARRGVAAHVRRHRVRQGVAVVAVLVLVFVVGAALVGRHGQSAEQVVTNTGAVPHLIPAYMSDQLRFTQVVDLPAAEPGRGTVVDSRLWIYATGGAGDPLGGTSFGVQVIRETSPQGSPSGTEPTPGFAGYVPATMGQRAAVFRIDGANSFEVLSSQLSDEQLRALGETVRIGTQGSTPTLDHVTVPPGYHEVVAASSASATTVGAILLDANAHGYVEAFGSARADDIGDREMLMTVETSRPADLDAVRWSLQGVTRVDVNGRSAVLGSLPGGLSQAATSSGQGGPVTPGPRTWILSWFLDDGTTRVTMQVLGGLTPSGCTGDCTPQVMEQIARNLHVVGDARWRAFASATTTTTLAPGCATTPNGGQSCTFSGQGTAVGVSTTVTGGH